MVATSRILVADDEPELCGVLKAALEVQGWNVEAHTDPVKALDRLRGERFHVLVTDIRMPGIDGFELLRRAREVSPDLVNIVMTGYADLDTAVGALRQGAVEFLQKPFRLEDLVSAVRGGLKQAHALGDRRRTMERLMQTNDVLAQDIAHVRGELEEFNRRLASHTQQAGILSDMGDMLVNEVDIDGVCGTCLEVISRRLGVTRSSIMLADEDFRFLEVRAAFGPRPKPIVGTSQPIHEGVGGHVMHTGKPLLAPPREGAHERPTRARRPAAYSTDSFLCVPLVFEGRSLGVISVNDKRDGSDFTQADRQLLVSISKQVALAVHNARLYGAAKDSCVGTVQAFALTLEAKDDYTCGHSRRVTDYAVRTGERMGLAPRQLDTIRFAGLLHDIGKIGISENILNKAAPLSESEYASVKQHPVTGERIVRSLDSLSDVRRTIRQHHERWDGRGYPDRLAEDQIDITARIIAVADAFDAMSSARPYRSARTPAEARDELLRCAGTQFDPDVARSFIKVVPGLVQADPEH